MGKSLFDTLLTALEPFIKGEKMTQKQIVRQELETRKAKQLGDITAYSLTFAVENQSGYRPAESTIRRVIRDLRADGVDISTKEFGGYELQ